VEAISAVVADLPRDLHAAVMVVLHVSRGRSVMPEILTRAGRLPAIHPQDGERIRYGHIYVAPPDHHLVVEGNLARVIHGPSENGVRPAVDPLFRSAARHFGARVIGVVLTGALDDGTAGLGAVKQAGGIAIVQDPEEAFAPSMPRSAKAYVNVDHVLPLREIGTMLTSLVREHADVATAAPGEFMRPMEPDLAAVPLAVNAEDRPGVVSVFSCPECHGTLWEEDQEGLLRFRCRVGHVYSVDSMLAAQTDSVDRALWAALRSLEERAALTRKLSRRARERKQSWVANAFEERAAATEEHAAVVREILLHRTTGHSTPESAAESPSEPLSVTRQES
jgi:two-component system chemotaxis response regulator CheB